MEPIVLVTYATRYGSTEEVAKRVAETLGDSGLVVEVQPVRMVRSLERYSAVVLGIPIYMTRFHKHARRFLSAHRVALTKRPVALFVLGPLSKDEKDWIGARRQMEKEVANFPWLSPVAQVLLGGSFDPAKLDFPYNLIPPLRKMPASDVRDWTAIRAWANELSLSLRPVSHA